MAIGISLSPFAYAGLTAEELQEALIDLSGETAQIALNAEEALALIELANEVGVPFPEGTIALTVTNMFQGTNPSSATFDSRTWLEYCVNYQDSSECGTTQILRPAFSSFPAFDNTPLFSFTDVDDPLRTLIDAEIRTVTDYSLIGTDFCHDAPRWNIKQSLLINGINIDIPRQLFGAIEFNETTHIMKNIGVKFTPQLIERLLDNAGVNLQTGDKIRWVVDGDYRYTVWKGHLVPFTDRQLAEQNDPDYRDYGNNCGVTGELAFDGYGSKALVRMDFVYVDALDQILRPTTVLPDTDGDGIPDQFDECSFSRETFNGIEDEDGCPDIDPDAKELPFDLQDADLDGIVNGDDNCTFLPENYNGIEDGDGCPDGQSVENIVVDTIGGELVIELTGNNPIEAPLITVEELIAQVEEINNTPTVTDEVEDALIDNLVEDDPVSNISETGGVVVTGNDPAPVQYCNNFVTDCNAEISRAIQIVEMTTGIPLPFPPTILNLVIVFAIISVVMVIIIKFVVNRR